MLTTYKKRGKRGTRFSEDGYLLFFCGRRNALETSMVILRGKRSAVDVSRCVFSSENLFQVLRLSHKKTFDIFLTCENVTKCHACHAKRH